MELKNKILVTMVTLSVIITCGTIYKDLNEKMEELNVNLVKNDKVIRGISSDNEKLSKDNADLLISNEELELQNKELQNKINDISFKKVSFNHKDVTRASDVGYKQLEILFNVNSRYSNFKGLEQSFVDAEREYGINAIFLLSIVSQESEYGKSDRALNDNNMSGLAVYNSKSKGLTFSSKHDSIMYLGRLLSEEYVKGRNIKDIRSINEVYCPDDDYHWSNNIISISNKYMSEINGLLN